MDSRSIICARPCPMFDVLQIITHFCSPGCIPPQRRPVVEVGWPDGGG